MPGQPEQTDEADEVESTAFLVAILKFITDHLGPDAAVRLLDVLGERGYAAARRRRRNDLIRELDRVCRGEAVSIRHRAGLVERALSIAGVPSAADIAGDRKRALAREILALCGGRPPSFNTVRAVIVHADLEHAAAQARGRGFA